jgi:hypothetical protein
MLLNMNVTRQRIFIFIMVCFAFVVSEGFFFATYRLGILNVRRPTYSIYEQPGFWADINEDFGVWHVPGSRIRHISACFDVTYEANSYGARDGEHSLTSDFKRVVVLGDSFVEGMGVAFGKRTSELLQKQTGVEHMNFATGGVFGPTQYYLLYKTLASKFTHDAVLVGILPCNDFSDDDFETGKETYYERYRPYLVGTYPNYEIVYYRKPIQLSEWNPTFRQYSKWLPEQKARKLLRDFTWSYNGLYNMKELLAGGWFWRKSPQKTGSMYYDFTDAQFDMVRYSLEQIKRIAGVRKVCVFTIPVIEDIVVFDRKGAAPLNSRMQAACDALGIEYVDLLPAMHSRKNEWKSYYFLPFDGHWCAHGNAAAAGILEHGFSFYSEQKAGQP